MIALDTSVAIPALASWHEHHQAALSQSRGAMIPAHALLETFSVLTRLPAPHRIASPVVAELLAHRYPPQRVLVPSEQVARSAVARLAAAGVHGAASYDGIIALTAATNGAELLTADRRAAGTYVTLGVPFRILETA